MHPRLLTAALALLALTGPVAAQNPRPRAQLLDAPLPLSLNLGGGNVNNRQAAAVVDLFGAVQSGVNALANSRGQPNGIATLGGDGLIPAIQLPSYTIVGAIQAAANTAAVKTLLNPTATVTRLGFANPNDGGRANYSYSTQPCASPDDGAQIQSSILPGCWIAQFSAGPVDVRIWGAQQGQVIDTPLRAAIAWACTSHAPLQLPYTYTGGQYLLNSQINIGNGSVAAYSTCNNVSLEVVNNYAVTTSGTFPPLGMPIRWTGPGNGIPINVQGPATVMRLKGLGIDCNSICATGIRVSNVLDGKFEDLSVEHNIGPAFIVTSEPTNNLYSSMEGSRFANIHADFPSAGGSGMRIGDVTCTANCVFGVLGNIFENMTFNYDGNVAGTFGIQFGMASQNTLINPRTTPFYVGGQQAGSKGNAIKISPPPGNLLYPTGNTFLNPIIAGPVDPGPDEFHWGGQFGGFHFIGWSTVYQPFPTSTVPGRFTGTDAAGGVFATNSPAGTFTATDGSGAGLGLTVQDAQWTRVGKICTVSFALTYPSNASQAVATIAGLPCSGQFGATSRAGGSPSYTDVGAPFTILVGDGVPTASFYSYGGAAMVNSQLSGKTIRATLTYLTD